MGKKDKNVKPATILHAGTLSGPHRFDEETGAAPGYARVVIIRVAQLDKEPNKVLAQALARSCASSSPHVKRVKVAPHLHA